ncbi:MAG: HAD-IA family hydrolase [Candidatus Thiodiazotropha sp. (ex Lucinoma aequizonata)]|nr:HAD-IA family hydrolase [Candidatus Thiodiazotropha sp. (ex Lucinoma aequizonata)]MCU7887916.1 HAD-IA family hydrolase [Candidatus Thiodiazotropha sp. (ex Lucinoma aequizonata)]MCU7893902.1 HAD-IA family hydrolase [Candidatus Thiodiazotropha sp. (ex Lucinoma aequizonata)]MCU7898426.1 HAD-IA family hydrolase [Candidatus Thiodiazotropha sp. (ex Lucinoma aequizonata)]MCU7901057.1 HAD-IA family hydrolase [Candidatus Thiodiazotropha sp. (ex Lucinoma aequizonata)]
MPIKCVLFDLDGTFADTAADLHFALNLVLSKQGRETVLFEKVRPAVSHGSQAMLKVAFDIEPDDVRFTDLQKDFLQIYLNNIAVYTKPFDGMETLIKELEQREIHWGIVTNKPAWLTDPLMQKLGIDTRANAIVSGDTTPYAKPHQQPILYACLQSGIDPSQTLYVGDAIRDIEAGRNAGTKTLVALFGYLGENDHPDEWQADGQINHPLEILQWL